MKCIGKPVTTWTIPRSITLSPLHLMLFRGKSNTFGTVYSIVYRNGDWYGACLSISMKIYWSGRCCRSRSCCCSSGSSHSKQCGSGYCSLLLFFYFFGECTVQVRNKKIMILTISGSGSSKILWISTSSGSAAMSSTLFLMLSSSICGRWLMICVVLFAGVAALLENLTDTRYCLAPCD